jgi:hypothetical protein
MFSSTFRPNGAQIKIRKGACARGPDMRYPQSCPPDPRTGLPAGDIDIDREDPGVGRGFPARRNRGGGFRQRSPIGMENGWSAEFALLGPTGAGRAKIRYIGREPSLTTSPRRSNLSHVLQRNGNHPCDAFWGRRRSTPDSTDFPALPHAAASLCTS